MKFYLFYNISVLNFVGLKFLCILRFCLEDIIVAGKKINVGRL